MTTTAGPPVPDLVDAGLRRVFEAMERARAQRDRGRLTDVEWTVTMALLYTRRARWWAILDRATLLDHTIHSIYYRAVLAAWCNAETTAEQWTNRATATAAAARAEVA